MKKNLLTFSFLIAACISSQYASASLINGSTLSFTPLASGATPNGFPADGLGSWFSMEVNPADLTITSITSLNGLVLGSTQLASPVPVVGNIDMPWSFFGNTGAHQSVSDTNVLSASGDVATIDFSGWNFIWNDIPSIDMSTGVWNGSTEGVADVVCADGSGCGNGASYTLDYSAIVPNGDPSSFGGVRYALHLEGTISAVPVPAAVWLFGSGFLSLIGVARRKVYR